MLIIGEKVNVMSLTIGPAMKNRDPKPIQDMAAAQVEAGANALDINIGPARKDGPEMMEWVVNTVQDAVDVTLCLDTTNAEAMEAGLKVCKKQPIINSASGEPTRLETMTSLAAKYDAKLIGLTMPATGIPRDANGRMAIAVDIMTKMAEKGVPLENLYLDPLILPIAVSQEQALEGIEAIKMFRQLNDPPLKTVVGLSNISNGALAETKPLLDRTYLTMLATVGLDAAIADPFDKELMDTVKTVRILRNEVLYCHSYLD